MFDILVSDERGMGASMIAWWWWEDGGRGRGSGVVGKLASYSRMWKGIDFIV